VDVTVQGAPPGKTVDLRVSPSAVEVDADRAHHLTLILNELATNTLKHALRGRDAVRIDVALRCDGRKMVLTYRDDGPGYPSWVLERSGDAETVGTRLIRGLAERSLGGAIEFDDDEGAVTVISFDLAAPPDGSRA
jgi:two-component sensor histidine kinase